MPKILRAESEDHFEEVRVLMSEYVEWDRLQTEKLGLDAKEFTQFYYGQSKEELPGVFAPPRGCLLLAFDTGRVAGCGAIQPFDQNSCELKRMYVRPAFRGLGAGRKIADALIANARVAAYESIRLETTIFMQSATAMYESLGFRRCEPYYVIPPSFREITIFMELHLT